jgi:hypothetical protein
VFAGREGEKRSSPRVRVPGGCRAPRGSQPFRDGGVSQSGRMSFHRRLFVLIGYWSIGYHGRFRFRSKSRHEPSADTFDVTVAFLTAATHTTAAAPTWRPSTCAPSSGSRSPVPGCASIPHQPARV